MKKILIISNGSLPVPAVNGGAVETLIDTFVRHNEKNPAFEIEVASCYHTKSKQISDLMGATYHYIRIPIELTGIDKVCYWYMETICHDWRSMFLRTKQQQHYYCQKISRDIILNSYDAVIVENNMSLLKYIYHAMGSEYIHKCYYHMHSILIDNCDMIPYLAQCRKILTVSEYVRNKLYQTIPEFKNVEIQAVLNGVDVPHISLNRISGIREKFMRQYHITKDSTIFLYSGRLSPEKGVLELIKAFCSSNIEKAILIIMGSAVSGKNTENSYVNSLKTSAFNEKVIFTGYIPHQMTAKFYSMCDVVVVPSIVEDAGPLTVLEAMAYHRFLILSNIGGIPEYTKDYSQKIYVEHNDTFIENLKEAIEKCVAMKKQMYPYNKVVYNGQFYFNGLKKAIEI